MAEGACQTCLFYFLLTLMMLSALSNIVFGAIAVAVAYDLNEASDKLDSSDSKNLAEILTGTKMIGIVAIVSGCLEFFLAMLGCIGLAMKSSGYLKLFAGICFVFLIVDVILLINHCVTLAKSDSKVEEMLDEALKKYDGKDNFNSFYLDQMQVKSECCGARGKDDYKKSKWYKSTDRQGEMPLSCCKLKTEGRKNEYSLSKRKLEVVDLDTQNCTAAPSAKDFAEKPCLEKEKDRHKTQTTLRVISTILKIIIKSGLVYFAWTFAK